MQRLLAVFRFDVGNCNPRFFRMTTYNLPTTEDLLTASQLPLGLIIQPLAQLRADEVNTNCHASSKSTQT